MEPLMLRAVDAARKLRRPVREDYIPPVDKVQNLFEAGNINYKRHSEFKLDI